VFKEISSLQKKELYNFIKGMDLTYNKTYIEMYKAYESDTLNEGNTVFIAFQKGKIKGCVALITKEISIKGEAFITDIYVKRENTNNKLKGLNTELVFKIMIDRAVEYCNMCNANSIKIGIRESEKHLIQYINKFGFNYIYDALVMKYERDRDAVLKINNEIELQPLSILNSQEYMNMHNEAFKNSPNGGSIDEVEVKDYIVQYANNEDLIGICFDRNKPCGIYELSIDVNIGWIDALAIRPIYQNSGLGKLLIIECIKKLFEKNLQEVKLLVITSNNIAFNMYKKCGFEEERVFSYWFEKKL